MTLRPKLADLAAIGLYTGRIMIGVGLLMAIPLLVAVVCREWNPALEFYIGMSACLTVGLATETFCPTASAAALCFASCSRRQARHPGGAGVPPARAARAERRQILVEVWGPPYANETHYLRVFMAQLRRKVEADPNRPRLLVTEAGVGYRMRDTEPDREPDQGRRAPAFGPAALERPFVCPQLQASRKETHPILYIMCRMGCPFP